MSNQDFGRAGSSSTSRREGGMGTAGQYSQRGGSTSASSIAEDAASKAKKLASDAAGTVTEQTKRLLDGQLGAGADLIAQVAGATKRASEELKEQSPQLAELVHSIGDRVEDYSDQLREQSVQELMRNASDFTRRQPAVVFGLAALAGFFAWRVVKAAPTGSTVASPPIQPNLHTPSSHTQSSQSYGARTY